MVPPSALGARHPEVERLRRLLRRRSDRASERAFVVEGPKLVAEAIAAGAPLEAIYVADGVELDLPPTDVPVHALQRGVLERVADTVTPQPVLAICRSVDVPLAAIDATFVVVCVDLQDPGNAGTILRSAEAAGAGAVVFAGASVDVSNPKAVRASAGSLFHVPVVNGGDAVEVLDELGRRGLRRLGTVARSGEPLDDADLTVPVALVLGNEAHGLPAEVDAVLDGHLTIPMAGRSESLNVGMATAVLCFEVARQRREVQERRG
ncbi:MAG: rRNA methylase [Actinomycetia bacterium]|nr:rRNA methylase [Actinomycetes bacterium]